LLGWANTPAKACPAGQPGAARKTRAAGHAASGRQPGATLGAARLDNEATTLGGHAGAKTVGALAVNDTGLERPLHGDSLKRCEMKQVAVFNENGKITD
jgi:hypothetical protein